MQPLASPTLENPWFQGRFPLPIITTIGNLPIDAEGEETGDRCEFHSATKIELERACTPSVLWYCRKHV